MKFSEALTKIRKQYHDHVLEHRSDPVSLYRAHSDALEHALQSLKTNPNKS